MNTLLIGVKRNLLSFASYPKTALAETMFMFLNNMFFLLVWYVIIQKHTIAGWGIHEALLFLGAGMLSYGIVGLFFGGLRRFETIINGSFDLFFLRPKNLFLQYATHHLSFADLGDLLSGIFLLSLSGYSLPVISLVTTVAVLVQILFLTSLAGVVMILKVINEHITFYLFEFFLMTEVWPSHAVSDLFLRLIFIFLIPGMLSLTIPVEAILGQASMMVVLGGLLFWTLLAVGLWRIGIRSYEGLSGAGWLVE